jgi:uncharacterized protein YhaN
MRIERIRLERFRRFQELDIELSPGLNVVRGPNESGKSTLVSAIVAGLFFKTATQSQSLRSLMSWGTDEAPVVEMLLEFGGEHYALRKDFSKRQAVIEAPGGKALKSQKAIDAAISEMTGLEDGAQYLRTACVTHDQLASLGDRGSARKLATMLDEVVIGKGETASVDSAVAWLTSQVDELKRGLERPASNPGTIKGLVDRRSGLVDKQRELSSRADRVDTDSGELGRLEEELAGLGPRRDEIMSLLEKNSEATGLESRLERASDAFEWANAAGDARKKLEDVEAEISEASSKGEPSAEDGRRLRSIASEREAIEAERTGLKSRLGSEKRRPPKRIGLVGLAAGAVLVGLGVWLGTINAALFSILAVGLALLLAGAWSTLQSSRGRAELAGFLQDRAAELDEKLEQLAADQARILEDAGCDSADEFFETLVRAEELGAERGKARAALEALTRSSADPEEARKKSALDAAAAEARLEELAPFRLKPFELAHAEREIKEIDSRMSEMEKQRERLRTRLSAHAAEGEELLAVEEEISWLWEEEQKARKRMRVCLTALEGMKLARQSMLSSAAPVLAEGVGRTLEVLTMGRYDTVNVAPEDLSISVYSKEKGGMVPADDVLSTLSKGTSCQLYLSARLELARLLTGGRMPPLVFDDAFSHFDEERLDRLQDLLLEASREWQIILMTCTHFYDGLAERGARFIELDLA